MFLLSRWRRNISRCFARWLISGLIEIGVDEELTPLLNHVITSNGITSKAGNLYSWTKQGRNTYKKDWYFKQKFLLDVEVARDCINRAVFCSWWNWLGGSRPFFWR